MNEFNDTPARAFTQGKSGNIGAFAENPFRQRLDQEGIGASQRRPEAKDNGVFKKSPVAFSSHLGFNRLAGRAFTRYADIWTAYTGSGGAVLQTGLKAFGRMVPPSWTGWHLAIRVPRSQASLLGIPFPLFVYFKLSTFVSLSVPQGTALSHSVRVFDSRAGGEIDSLVAEENTELFEIFCQGYEERSWSRQLVFSNASPKRITGAERVLRSMVGLFWQGSDPTVADYNELRNFERKVGKPSETYLTEIRKNQTGRRIKKTLFDDRFHVPAYSKASYPLSGDRGGNYQQLTLI